ncbi:MAG TPA: hypothetical protein VFN72_04905 [Solirubrobacterales bacterium]|nr:hypothetical protein [Solirubrobacterales bacterium]
MGPRSKFLLLLAAAPLAACVSMRSGGEPTALMRVTGTDISSGQLRALGNELAIRIPAIIEISGDRMLARTEDPLLRRRALSWKIEGTAAFHQALFRPDALGAAVETYALSVQLEDWVKGPGGQRYYGDLQPILIGGVEQIRREIENQALSVAKDPDNARASRERVAAWAHENPIDEHMSNRPSLHAILVRMAANQNLNLTDAFAGITANVADLQTRLDVYAWTLPKVARWQAEMAAIDLTSVDPGKLAVATLQRADALLTRVDALGSPESIRQLSSAATSSLRNERVAVMGDIDRQRREITDALTRERVAILGNVDAQRIATLADIDRKIAYGFDRADEMRLHTLADVEGILTRTLFRIAVGLAALMLLGGLVVYLLLRTRARTSPGGPP